METEIQDLQGEFELDRLDYLETIRKQDQQLKLFIQIMEKIQPIMRKEYNYSNFDSIRRDAIWNEDTGKWIIPQIYNIDDGTNRTALPNANQCKF